MSRPARYVVIDERFGSSPACYLEEVIGGVLVEDDVDAICKLTANAEHRLTDVQHETIVRRVR